MVPLGEVAGYYVRQILTVGRPTLAKKEVDSGLLFVMDGGNSLDCSVLRRLVKKYVKATGIKKNVTPHTFRHTCATHM